MEQNDSISQSFENTIKDANLLNAGTDLSEVLLDNIVQNDVLREIPIIGTLVNIGKASINIKDRLFLKKILHFLNEFREIPPDERNKMISQIDESKKFRIRVGEKLMFILDKCDDFEKAEYLGIFFNCFLSDRCSYADFLRYSDIVERVFIEDFKYFLNAEDSQVIKEIDSRFEQLNDLESHLVSVGLCATYSNPISVRDQDDYKMSEQYVVEGGEIGLTITEVGKDMKFFINLK